MARQETGRLRLASFSRIPRPKSSGKRRAAKASSFRRQVPAQFSDTEEDYPDRDFSVLSLVGGTSRDPESTPRGPSGARTRATQSYHSDSDGDDDNVFLSAEEYLPDSRDFRPPPGSRRHRSRTPPNRRQLQRQQQQQQQQQQHQQQQRRTRSWRDVTARNAASSPPQQRPITLPSFEDVTASTSKEGWMNPSEPRPLPRPPQKPREPKRKQHYVPVPSESQYLENTPTTPPSPPPPQAQGRTDRSQVSRERGKRRSQWTPETSSESLYPSLSSGGELAPSTAPSSPLLDEQTILRPSYPQEPEAFYQEEPTDVDEEIWIFNASTRAATRTKRSFKGKGKETGLARPLSPVQSRQSASRRSYTTEKPQVAKPSCESDDEAQLDELRREFEEHRKQEFPQPQGSVDSCMREASRGDEEEVSSKASCEDEEGVLSEASWGDEEERLHFDIHSQGSGSGFGSNSPRQEAQTAPTTNFHTPAAVSVGDDDGQFSISSSMENAMAEIPIQPPESHPTLRPFDSFQFGLQYEVTRISLAMGVSVDDLTTDVPKFIAPVAEKLYTASNQAQQWQALKEYSCQLPNSNELEMPEPLASNVWKYIKESKGWPQDLELSGTASFKPSKKLGFDITLNPLARSKKSNRFATRFGSDRFLTLRLPTARPGSPVAEETREKTVEWLVHEKLELLNRTWRCFYVRDGADKRKVRVEREDSLNWGDPGQPRAGQYVTESYFLAYFFAERGVGLGPTSYRKKQELGFVDDEKICRDNMSRGELIEWHMPLEKHLDKTFSKVWSRISLGLSTANPTVTFHPNKVVLVDDMVSSAGKIMNDGCSVCSPMVMRIIREKLDLAETPTVVQGRLGGAKGVWFIDPEADRFSDEVSIKITPSQLKYEHHDSDLDEDGCDWARLTLFVLKYSIEPRPANLNIQFVPLLSQQGVPFEAFQELLEQHLEEDLGSLLKAAIGRVALRHYLGNHGMDDRYRSGEIACVESGTPLSDEEQIDMLLDAGFNPVECGYLANKVKRIVRQKCDNILDKLHIRVPCSAIVFCIADPTGHLREGEVSLQFSKGFLDPVTQTRQECIEGDILVARNPAHLPTDIQKVRAVLPMHPGLRQLKDVIVFSTRGDIPLADMLSGGDYDGDQPWVCWDQRLVAPFRNSGDFAAFKKWDQKLFFEPTCETHYLRDLPGNLPSYTFFDNFFHCGFASSMQDNLLGLCTNLLERYTYDRAIRGHHAMDDTAIHLANLCGVLVDAPKQGIRPKPETKEWIQKLSRRFRKQPRYKGAKFSDNNRPEGGHTTWFILDSLILHVGRKLVTVKRQKIEALIEKETSKTDRHLSELFNVLDEKARGVGKDPHLAKVLRRLHDDLTEVGTAWRLAMARLRRRAAPFGALFGPVYAMYNAIAPAPEVEAEVDRRMRAWYQQGRESRGWGDGGGWGVYSEWRLLKASKLFAMYPGEDTPWWMAMPELCFLKALRVGDAMGQPPRQVVGDVYFILKPKRELMETNELEVESGL